MSLETLIADPTTLSHALALDFEAEGRCGLCLSSRVHSKDRRPVVPTKGGRKLTFCGRAALIKGG